MTKLLAVSLIACAAFAQSDTASLSGAVTDSGAAAVAGAKITLRNVATHNQRTALSDIQGLYRFSLLIPGNYEITIDSPGMKQFHSAELTLNVAQAGRLDVQLEVGSNLEIMEVRTQQLLLNAETASQGTVIGEEKIKSLPLNGRQFLQLALLVPGANAGGRAVQQNLNRQGAIGGLSVSGGRTNNTAFLLDGGINLDPDYNSLNYNPSIDAIAEFQVQTGLFPAEFGRASGGQINVVTKSGGNTFHGSAFEFLRNNALDARPFNLPVPQLPEYRRNQFGATAGGPIKPNKVFWFFSYDALRLRQAGAGLTTVTVPTTLQLDGNFSATKGGIFDPDTLQNGVRTPFPGNIIPSQRINASALAAAKAMPLPNLGTSGFVNANGLLKQTNNNYSGRVDYLVTSSLNLFGRYSMANEDAIIPATVTGRDNVNNVRPQNFVVGLTKTIKPTLVTELRVAFSRFRQVNGLPELDFNVGSTTTHLPQFLVSGYPTMGGAGSFTGTTAGGIVMVRDNTYQVYDNVLWEHGRHAVKFGGEAVQVQYNRYEAPSSLANFQFTNGFTTRTAATDGTGDALASFYLALPAVSNRSVGPSRIDGRQWLYSAYVQDDFRVLPSLTLNFGLRYELAPPVYDARQQMASIDYSNVPSPQAIFASGKTAFYKPQLFICGQGNTPRGCAHTDYNNFAPRAGIVWSANPKTVIRAGAGVYYAASDFNPLFRLAAGLPDNLIQTLTSNNFVPQFRGFDIFGPAVVGASQIQQAGIDINQRTSYSLQWTFTIQRELPRKIVVEAGYMASLGLKLEQNVQPNNAQPGLGAIDPRRPYVALDYAPGTTFPSYVNVQGSSVPVGFINYLPHSAQSNYHALNMRLEKPFKDGLSWLTSYTFSKSITNAPQFRNAGGVNGSENSPAQDAFNLQAERGLAAYDVRHRLVNTVVFQLPFGRTQKYLRYGLGSKILGGWELSGIVSAQSGFPYTINLRGDTAGVGAGTGGIFVRPNAVPGVSYQLPSSQMSTSRYFNTAAFTAPATGAFGNVGRNTLIGPAFANADAVVSRHFRIKEREDLQFRAEFFNALNHPNFTLVGRILNDPTFGQVLSQADPRELQFGFKFTF
uniref:TonB-dependent receptor n=1 Tax=Solibacter usitatus (strain Ellin6076) TaxID=234267 RepID=Q022L1_SOLUE